ncbi:MAG: IS4 family transposase [Chloroflexi bacterium]|nr:IS4 family transposase [Chloroflexota bacterium]
MYSDHLTSAPNWCHHEFANVELKDARLENRCKALAVALSTQPSLPINQACEDWTDTKAAYRFFANEKITHERILQPHQQRTIKRMSLHSLVLAVQDTSFLNYTHHPRKQGMGEIGNKQQNQQGIVMHSTLALTSEGMPLGVLDQQIWARPVGEPGKTPAQCRQQPIEEKESYKWLQAFQKTINLSPDNTKVLTICDREADIYEMFALAEEENVHLLVRANFDRVLMDESEHKLWAKVKKAPVAGSVLVHIPKSDTQPKRDAILSVRYTSVTLKPPWRPNKKKLPVITLQAVLAQEENPPDGVEKPIEWLLLTNCLVGSFEDAVQIIKWYRCRWQIEVFHKVLKSGCAIEQCRLETAERLLPFIALKSVIAWRLHWITYINRHEPNKPCTIILATHEWEALYMRIHRTSTLPAEPPTVREAVRWIGQLGGFLGRKGDGEPGVTAIWRGWHRLQDFATTWYLVKEQTYG